MRAQVFASFLLLITLTSCATDSGAIRSGRVGDVSAEDIRAAIAVDRKEQSYTWQGKLTEIEVVNRNEIHLFWNYTRRDYPGHHIVKRIHGVWRSAGRIVVTS